MPAGGIVDLIDQNIIKELQKNARLTNNELAEKVHLSPSPCLRRVRKLEEVGLIKGYTAIIDAEKYGLPVNVFVSIRVDSPASMVEFEKAIHQFDEIIDCYLMTGACDYLLKVVSKDLKSYEHFIREKMANVPGISKLESSFAFGAVKTQSPLPSRKLTS